MATTHYNTMSFLDETDEVGSFTVYNDAVTAVSIAGYLTQLTDFRAKTNALTLGTNLRNVWVGDADDNARDLPGNNYAQRENKLRVMYQGVTSGKDFEISIPTIDLALLTFIPGGKDYVQFSGAGVNVAITNWVTSFEAIASSPDDPAENVVVTKMQYVGRNT